MPWFDASGFHWQPDIGYLLSNWDKGTAIGKGDGVFPFVRDDVLVVRSLLADGPPRVFITSLGEPLESALERAKEVDRQCLTTLRALQFDYLALLNTSIPVIAVVEMGRRSEHRDIMLHSLLPPSVDGRAHGPMSISSRLHASISGIWADGEKPDPEAILGAQLYYINYQHPYFDIRHTNIDVDFFGNEGERIELPGDVIAAYKAARDTAPIFIQHRDNVAFGAVHFLKWHLDSQGKTLEDYIPARERRADGNMFTLTFPIHFTEGSFYMNTRRGPRDLRELKLFVEITWRGVDNSRPRMDDLSWLSGLSTLED